MLMIACCYAWCPSLRMAPRLDFAGGLLCTAIPDGRGKVECSTLAFVILLSKGDSLDDFIINNWEAKIFFYL